MSSIRVLEGSCGKKDNFKLIILECHCYVLYVGLIEVSSTGCKRISVNFETLVISLLCKVSQKIDPLCCVKLLAISIDMHYIMGLLLG